MSIIHNALKKAQTELRGKNPYELPRHHPPIKQKATITKASISNQTKENQSPPRETRSKTKMNAQKLSVVFITLSFLLLVSYFSFNLARSLKKNPGIKNTSNSSLDTNQTSAPAILKEKDLPFKISGIMIIEDRKVLLVADEIYEVGDTVNGQEIISIELNKLKLRGSDGEKEYAIHTIL